MAGIGQDVAAFQAAWLAGLGAKAPAAVGPQVGPAGPLPPGWAAQPGAPARGASSGPVATGAPGAPNSPSADETSGGSAPAVLGLVVIGLGLVLAAVLFVRSRRRRAGGPP